MTGTFITFEGGEGTGKSTQAARLAAAVSATGREVVQTREPGGTAFAENVRRLVLDAALPRSVLAEALLFAAARADHVDRLIRPALERGAMVISDRFADSTRAYQGAAAGLDTATLLDLERIATGGLMPHLTVILDLPADVGLARARRRSAGGQPGDDIFETRDTAFHERLRQGFLAIAIAEPGRCAVVDAGGTADEVAERVRAAVAGRLDLGAA